MISDKQESDLNSSVKKNKSGLNPDAETFFYKKTEIPSVSTNSETLHETLRLTNGDVKADDDGGGLSSQGSPVSASPPAPTGGSLDTGCESSSGDAGCGSLLQTEDKKSCALPSENTEDDSAAVDDSMETTEIVKSVVDVASADGTKSSSVQSVQAFVLSTDPASQPGDDVSCAIVENGLDAADDHENVEDSTSASLPVEGSSRHSTSSPELRKQLLNQLEYYFSRDNLEQDHYLQSQMDDDQYVSITTIANFNQVVKLTRDYDLIVDVLRGSSHVQVDSTGTKVRPKYNRSVLMLREIPQDTPKSEVEAIFQHDKCPKMVSCEFAHNGYWYIKFKTDTDAIEAFLYLREHDVKFKGKPVMARIKANSLVRSVGVSSHFNHSGVMSSSHQQTQQNGAMPYIPQQPQAQYPMMTGPIPQFIGQHQVQQPMPQFQVFNFPTVLPQWTAAGATPHFLDPGAMLAINGYQAASIKSNNHHSRNMFHPLRSNTRGTGKPHRSQSFSTDKMPDPKPVERSHLHYSPSLGRSNHRSNSHHVPDLRSLPSGRSRSEGAFSSGPFSSHAAAAVSAAPVPLVSGDRGQNSVPVLPGSRTESAVTVPQARRGGTYRKPRRSDEGSRNMRSHLLPGSKEPHFDLQATSFPPLPGSSNNSSSSETSDGNRLSDVVRGANVSRPVNKMDDRVKPSTSNATVTPISATVSTAVQKCTVSTSTVNKTLNVSSRPAASSMGVEEHASSSPGTVSPTAEPACDKTATVVESSKHLPKPSKTLDHAVSQAASRPVSEAQTTSTRSAAVCSTTQVKATPVSASVSAVPSVPTSSSQGAAPVKLSYAQMVARKQAENTVKVSVENGASSQAASVAVTASCSQPEPSAACSSASAPVTSTSTSTAARPSTKEYPRRDFEPREQRFQGNRRTREYREHRQSRFESRRSDREVKVPTK